MITVYYPKDETGREWRWVGLNNWPAQNEILGTPAKFGAAAYNDIIADSGPVKVMRSDASEDFNFGSGDFCIAGWGILASAWWNAFPSHPEEVWVIWQYYMSSDAPVSSTFCGHAAWIASEEYSDIGTLNWKFSSYNQGEDLIETFILTHEFVQADFDDQYHYFTFARSGDVFSMYIDGVRVAYETHAITLSNDPYDDEWDFYYWYRATEAY